VCTSLETPVSNKNNVFRTINNDTPPWYWNKRTENKAPNRKQVGIPSQNNYSTIDPLHLKSDTHARIRAYLIEDSSLQRKPHFRYRYICALRVVTYPRAFLWKVKKMRSHFGAKTGLVRNLRFHAKIWISPTNLDFVRKFIFRSKFQISRFQWNISDFDDKIWNQDLVTVGKTVTVKSFWTVGKTGTVTVLWSLLSVVTVTLIRNPYGFLSKADGYLVCW